MLANRFLPRMDFTDYQDFRQNYRVNVPEPFNFGFDVVDVYAQEEPHRPALYWCNDDDAEATYTFKDVSDMSSRVANHFASLGVQRGDVVMLILRQRPEVWWSMVGLHKLSAIVVPASFQLTPKDIVYRCNAAHVKQLVVVDDAEILQHLDTALPDCPSVEAVGVVGFGLDAPQVPNAPLYYDYRAALQGASATFARHKETERNDDPMLIYFTSGTTGMPKMAWHNFTYPLGHITTALYWHKIVDGGLHLTDADSGWAKFGWGKMYGQWICGCVQVAHDRDKFVPAKLLALIDRLHLSTFCAPPTIYRFLIKENLAGHDFSSIVHATTAGEPLNPEVYHQFKKATGLEIHEGLGQSETTVYLANFGFDELRVGSTGKPAPLYDVDLIDEKGRSCEDGEVGSIVVRAWPGTDTRYPTGLFRGYYLDDNATARDWSDGVYNTGDTAWRDGDGYYWFVGRNDDVIKCSGYRIGPFEVESALMEHPCVLECAVTAAPDSLRGQVVKATIVLAKGYVASETLIKELQDHVKHVTAPYKYPRIVAFVEELPKTTSGKIRRMSIRDADTDK